MKLEVLIPENLVGKIMLSGYVRENARGEITSYCMDLRFDEMHLCRTVVSRESGLMRGKIEHVLKGWSAKYEKHVEREHKESRAEEVEGLNKEAQNQFGVLESILEHTLEIDDSINWDLIKRKDRFHIEPAELFDGKSYPSYIFFNETGKPLSFEKSTKPASSMKSAPTLQRVSGKYGFFSRLFNREKIREDFNEQMRQWEQDKKEQDAREQLIKELEDKDREVTFDQAVTAYESEENEFNQQKKQDNDEIDEFSIRYKKKEAKAIEEYCDLVLSNSEYPDYFPQSWEIEYREESKILVVEYDLPFPEQLPDVESYKYNKAQDKISEKKLSAAASKKLYESVIYQICIRVIHELLEADVVNALDAIAFNGLVTHVNPATGVEETKIIMSVQAGKEEFLKFNLSNIDPKATFKHMKGLSAASLVDLTPIPPTIGIEKTDKRFVEGRNVVSGLSSAVNLATMHWGDFEHLIREMFEQEFAANGGEVKVTQASSDGGVDAIAFDPDPIRGGKIVIQAKRYTNVVGVAAVRDLYGTVMNEGATKGILVTTSDYGRDSYEFAKDKPLTLMNGNHLLSLLEKHGHKARIDIKEARKILNKG